MCELWRDIPGIRVKGSFSLDDVSRFGGEIMGRCLIQRPKLHFSTMLIEFPARGRVKEAGNGKVVFNPAGTNYELHLEMASTYDGPINSPVEAVIRAKARKVYSVPSGGNFIAPIFGSPRTIQGRVRYIDRTSMVVQCGTMIVVEFPDDANAVDLHSGAIAESSLVNVVAFPGATFELLPASARR